MKQFVVMPQYLGPSSSFVTRVIDGRLFTEIDGKMIEVISAGAKELSKLPYDLSEGLYVVGTGSSGAVEALGIIGAGYFVAMLASSMMIKGPHPSFKPPVAAPSKSASASTNITTLTSVPDITIEKTMLTPQFHLLGITFFCLATGGIGMLSVAKPMMSEIFSAALPGIVTSAFAANFLLMLSAGNLGMILFYRLLLSINKSNQLNRWKTWLGCSK
jgi:hypothetical protein